MLGNVQIQSGLYSWGACRTLVGGGQWAAGQVRRAGGVRDVSLGSSCESEGQVRSPRERVQRIPSQKIGQRAELRGTGH